LDTKTWPRYKTGIGDFNPRHLCDHLAGGRRIDEDLSSIACGYAKTRSVQWFQTIGFSQLRQHPQFRRIDEPRLNERLTVNSVLPGQISDPTNPATISLAGSTKGSPMRTLAKTAIFVMSFALVGSTVSAAFAETQWERNHPRRDQVNDRLANQNRRINHELKEGEITKQQANQLHRDDRAIRREERTMAKFNGGHITKDEQKTLNQQESAVSRQIGR
jgi:hypothetical protein